MDTPHGSCHCPPPRGSLLPVQTLSSLGLGTHSALLGLLWRPSKTLLKGQPGAQPSLCDRHPAQHLAPTRLCAEEGNGNPLQYSCLENHMDGGAWWAAVYGVAQSRTRLKLLSSSSSSSSRLCAQESQTSSAAQAQACPGAHLPCRPFHHQAPQNHTPSTCESGRLSPRIRDQASTYPSPSSLRSRQSLLLLLFSHSVVSDSL